MNNREESYLWAGPYACSRQVVAVRQDSDIQSLGDLAGHRVAVQISSKPEEIFSPEGVVVVNSVAPRIEFCPKSH